MGIDIHVGGRYIAFHVPTPVLLILAALTVYLIVKLARYAVAAAGGSH